MANDYYIINTDDKKYKAILALTTDFVKEKPRPSLDGTKAAVQIRDNVSHVPLLDGYTPIAHDEMVTLMNSDEWQPIAP